MEDRERELVERSQQGDREAFGELLRLYERRVFSLVRRMVWRNDEAVEVAQEVFVQAYKSRGRFEAGRPFRPWLFKIAINVCRAYGRSHSRRESATGISDDELGQWQSTPTDPESMAISLEEGERLMQALATLRPSDREVLLLRFWLDLPHKEVASILGRPQPVVKMRVHRALVRLRKQLDRMLQ